VRDEYNVGDEQTSDEIVAVHSEYHPRRRRHLSMNWVSCHHMWGTLAL